MKINEKSFGSQVYNSLMNLFTTSPSPSNDGLETEVVKLPSAEWVAQAFHDAFCPIEEVGESFMTWKTRHPGKTLFEVESERHKNIDNQNPSARLKSAVPCA